MKIFLGKAAVRRNRLVKESTRDIDPKLLAAYEEALNVLKTQDPSIDEDYLLYHLNGETTPMPGEAIWVDTPLGDITDEEQEDLFNYLTRERTLNKEGIAGVESEAELDLVRQIAQLEAISMTLNQGSEAFQELVSVIDDLKAMSKSPGNAVAMAHMDSEGAGDI
tara:strand:- start:1619 stop:2113 length:495 start_codon:yes stop_codon:yes gene_type:complete